MLFAVLQLCLLAPPLAPPPCHPEVAPLLPRLHQVVAPPHSHPLSCQSPATICHSPINHVSVSSRQVRAEPLQSTYLPSTSTNTHTHTRLSLSLLPHAVFSLC